MWDKTISNKHFKFSTLTQVCQQMYLSDYIVQVQLTGAPATHTNKMICNCLQFAVISVII